MQTINNTMETKVILDDTGKHRFILERTWNEELPKCAILMIFPCQADPIQTDLTTIITTNNLSKLGYGAVSIWNLFSKVNCSISTEKEPNTPESDECIKQSATEVETIILAYGKGGEGNRKIQKRIIEVLKLLEPFKDKVVVIEDPRGFRGFHPLTPSIRNYFKLVPFEFPAFEDEKPEAEKNKKGRKKSKKQDVVESSPDDSTTTDNIDNPQPDEETA